MNLMYSSKLMVHKCVASSIKCVVKGFYNTDKKSTRIKCVPIHIHLQVLSYSSNKLGS